RAAAVLVDEDGHPAQAGVVGGDTVAGLIRVLGAGDGEGLEVGEVQAALVGARRAGDGVAGVAHRLHVAGGQDLVDLLASVAGVQPRKGPGAVGGRGGGRVAGGQAAAGVLVDEDGDAAQPRVVGGDAVAGLVRVLRARDVER